MTLSKSRNSTARALMIPPAQYFFFEIVAVRVADCIKVFSIVFLPGWGWI
jgi:hypothetical protein